MVKDKPKGAVLSDDREYRYQLWRTWDSEKPIVAFIMLNPSTADESKDDPTIRRCCDFAERWGYGTLLVGNLFALRSKNPQELYNHPDPIGPENDSHLENIVDMAEFTVAAWGSRGGYLNRGQEIAKKFDSDLVALDTNNNGHPSHPLYLPKEIEPEPFELF